MSIRDCVTCRHAESQCDREPCRACIKAAGEFPRWESNVQAGPFAIGQRVRKASGSFQHTGTVQSEFSTRAGERRIVIEFDAPVQGMLHIYRTDQVEATNDEPRTA